MGESVVADFIGRFFVPGVENEPPKGRVVLSNRRLVLAAEHTEEHIPTDSIFDVGVGEVPKKLRMYFNDTVTVAYERDGTRAMAAVEGDERHIEQFSTILFKVLLNGTETLVRHPSRRGGRVTDVDPVPAKLLVDDGVICFERDGNRVEIDLDRVIGVDRSTRDLGAGSMPTVTFRHLDGAQAISTDATIESGRRTNLLGRYVRLRYSDVREELEDVTVSEEELEVLVAVYSAGGNVSLSSVVDFDPQRLTMVLRSLKEDDLIVDTEGRTELTMKGQVLVGQRLESVN